MFGEGIESKADALDTIASRHKSCGYRIQLTCASCVNCERTFNGRSHAERMISARCRYHDFDVNLDRGICDHFDNVGKYRG